MFSTALYIGDGKSATIAAGSRLYINCGYYGESYDSNNAFAKVFLADNSHRTLIDSRCDLETIQMDPFFRFVKCAEREKEVLIKMSYRKETKYINT